MVQVDLTVVVTERTASEARNEAAGRAEAVFTAIRRVPCSSIESSASKRLQISSPQDAYSFWAH